MEPGAHARGQCERVSASQMNTEVWHPLFQRSVDRKHGAIAPFLESQHVRTCPYRVSSVQKDLQRLQRGSLGRAMDTRVFERVLRGGVDLTFSLFRVAWAMSSGCQGLCLFHYILACEALFSATDGAMRACLWPMRPWFRARVRYSRSPLTCMTCLWIEKPVGNATKLPAQDQLRKQSAGVQHPQKSTKRTQTTDKVAENSH